jgi:Zn-dependent protease with chaperone function
VANAAAVGWAPGEAYVVVGRRLLDGFDREETQGVLAHLVGSIGNGDLRGAAHIHSLLYVMELMIVTVLAPFARRPRRIALRWLAFPLRPGRDAAARAERARELIGLLAGHRALMRPDAGTAAERLGRDYLGRIGSVLVRVCPPFLALLALAQAATGFLLLFASVPVALLWRSRRYLADATAVQLTRNPTGLYRALVRLGQSGALLPGGAAVAHLFVVGPSPGAPAGPAAAARGALWDREGLLMGWHPSPRRRLRRLLRMGAAPPAPDPPGARARAGAA